MVQRLILGIVSVMLLASGLVANVAYAQPAEPTIVNVTEADVTRQDEGTTPTDNWVLYTRPAAPGTAEFAAGPAVPPQGTGSLHLTTTTGSDKVFLSNFDYVGTPLASIDAISYASYRSAGSLQQVTALNLVVDENGPNVEGGFTTLVYEPVYNTDLGPVVDGQWQTWDAYNGGQGRWWSTRAIPGVCAFDCFVSWQTILTNNPDATVLGGFGVNQGSGNPGLTAAIDALTIGVNGVTTIYNFDLPTSVDLLTNLEDDTAALVDHPRAERTLLASLSRAERFLADDNPNNDQVAMFSLTVYILQVQLYEAFGIIPSDAADQLLEQAYQVRNSL